MIKILLIVYFHGTENYQSIFLFLNSVNNIYYTILYYTILYFIYISMLHTINIVGCIQRYILSIYLSIYIYIYIYSICTPTQYLTREGIETICEYLETRSDKPISSSIRDLTSFILKNNYFENEELKCRELGGFEIAPKFPPPYSNLFMAGYKTEFFKTVSLNSVTIPR